MKLVIILLAITIVSCNQPNDESIIAEPKNDTIEVMNAVCESILKPSKQLYQPVFFLRNELTKRLGEDFPIVSEAEACDLFHRYEDKQSRSLKIYDAVGFKRINGSAYYVGVKKKCLGFELDDELMIVDSDSCEYYFMCGISLDYHVDKRMGSYFATVTGTAVY